MTWDEIGRDSLEAAKLLREANKHRSSISRAYYAVYARVTAELEEVVPFPPERSGPSHKSLPLLAKNYLSRLDFPTRLLLRDRIQSLYDLRVEADYKPAKPIAALKAQAAIEEAERMFAILDAIEPMKIGPT